jgi:hypothetical protein
LTGVPELLSGDEAVRGALTRRIAMLGYAPTLEALADSLGRERDDVGAALLRLHDTHSLLLHPGSLLPWVVHPFALAPGGCWVQTTQHGYWANCLYCAFGIVASLRTEATITTRLGGEAEAVEFRVSLGNIDPAGLVFHLSTPAARWWDNVIFACSSFQPFRNESEVDAWCARHALPKGAVLTMTQLWGFASEWYGDYVHGLWRKRSVVEIRALFARHGLTGAFWEIA